MIEPNWTSLIPALVAIVTAILSRRPVESLLAGVAAGLDLGGLANYPPLVGFEVALTFVVIFNVVTTLVE
jgi:hypothetical protein